MLVFRKVASTHVGVRTWKPYLLRRCLKLLELAAAPQGCLEGFTVFIQR